MNFWGWFWWMEAARPLRLGLRPRSRDEPGGGLKLFWVEFGNFGLMFGCRGLECTPEVNLVSGGGSVDFLMNFEVCEFRRKTFNFDGFADFETHFGHDLIWFLKFRVDGRVQRTRMYSGSEFDGLRTFRWFLNEFWSWWIELKVSLVEIGEKIIKN